MSRSSIDKEAEDAASEHSDAVWAERVERVLQDAETRWQDIQDLQRPLGQAKDALAKVRRERERLEHTYRRTLDEVGRQQDVALTQTRALNRLLSEAIQDAERLRRRNTVDVSQFCRRLQQLYEHNLSFRRRV